MLNAVNVLKTQFRKMTAAESSIPHCSREIGSNLLILHTKHLSQNRGQRNKAVDLLRAKDLWVTADIEAHGIRTVPGRVRVW